MRSLVALLSALLLKHGVITLILLTRPTEMLRGALWNDFWVSFFNILSEFIFLKELASLMPFLILSYSKNDFVWQTMGTWST
jgi:hypothetical protein